MPRLRIHVPAALLALGLLVAGLVPARASACWDGFYVRSAHFQLQGRDDRWDVGRARAVGRYVPAIEALLVSHGAELEAYFGQATLTTPSGEHYLVYTDGSLGSLYRAIRRALRAPEQPLVDRALTVQVAATRDEAAAERHAAALNARHVGEPGVYDAGGFPADNPTAHVVRYEDDQGPLYRIVIGTFLERADADRAAAYVSQEVGSAFVRRL